MSSNVGGDTHIHRITDASVQVPAYFRAVKHRRQLSDSLVASVLEEIADAIPETLAQLKKLGLIDPPAFNPGHCDLRGREIETNSPPLRPEILGGK